MTEQSGPENDDERPEEKYFDDDEPDFTGDSELRKYVPRKKDEHDDR